MSRTKIAFVTPGTFPVPSGRSSSVELVATQVGERLKRQAEVTVFGKKTRRMSASGWRGGIRFVRPARKPYIGQVARLLKSDHPDLIQVENRPRNARYLKQKLPAAPVVLSLHSTAFMSPPHISPSALRLCLRAADAIVVNSQYLKTRVVAQDESIAEKVVVSYPGVDMQRFVSRWTAEEQAKREEQLARLGLSGKKIVLYVGRFIPIKGVHHLVAVMPTIAALEPDAVLLLVGGAYYGSNRLTPYVRKLRRMARLASPHIRFVPFVPHEQIPAWFRLADVAVVPSAEQEAFGLVNVEAMASGVPVVATAAGGMKEIIEHGVSGLLADPARLPEQLVHHVCSVLSDEAYARSLGERGLVRVRDQFTWQHTAERLVELYRSLGVRIGDAEAPGQE
ncbi:glycosyltransferase family 4 protein [Paenibacillus ginsengarvi]|uniref:Glycosyltransferase family 1 protein n=1 Tax=Paenibacillus ginsengarvi TaxID=400777 RepID=A0A3B0CHW8_9BACL|nr:glycosyltransferase family 1 protein [Paenibacillus ginsengarvi]